MTAVEVPARIAQEWEAELAAERETERIAALKQEAHEREAKAAPARIAKAEAEYLAARKEAESLLDLIPDALANCASLRYEYDMAWSIAQRHECAPIREAPLDLGAVLTTVMHYTGRA
jgi:hypothetical protein